MPTKCRSYSNILLSKLAVTPDFFRQTFSRIEAYLTDPSYFSSLFHKYSISQLIVTSISGVEDCEYALRSASSISLNSTCLLQSWDNPCGNGFRLVEPDLYLSYGKLITGLVHKYQDIPLNKITEIGALQYQPFINAHPTLKLQPLSTKSPLKILYAGKSSNRFPFNYVFAKILLMFSMTWVSIYNLPSDPHPISLVDYSLERQPQARVDLQKMIELEKLHPTVVSLDLPYSQNKLQATFDDDNSYQNIVEKIASYDIVINVFGSIALEACIAKTYCISVNYEAREYKYNPRKTRQNLFIDERQTHNQLLRHAIPTANSKCEMKDILQDIIGNNLLSLDHQMDLVREQLLGLYL